MTDITREAYIPFRDGLRPANAANLTPDQISETIDAYRHALDQAERERLAINLLLQAIHNGIYEYAVPDSHSLHQLVHEAIGSTSVTNANDILGSAVSTHIADLNAQVSILRERCDAAVARSGATEGLGATNPRRYERAVDALVRAGDVSQERVDIALRAIDSAWALAGGILDSPAFDRTRAALAKEGGSHG